MEEGLPKMEPRVLALSHPRKEDLEEEEEEAYIER